METKVLSIIVPTYKAEQFLDKGLSSFILDDGLMDKLEVIVVDDGTPDNSVEVAKNTLADILERLGYLVRKMEDMVLP